jgi:hypothetical protein
MDKKLLKDSRGHPLTQSLFLEFGYNLEYAVFTTQDEDYEHKGKTYISLKALYIAHEDVVEYDFATTYLLNWKHWQRICKNKLFKEHVEEWRFELELKMRSQAVKDIVDFSTGDKGFQAAKWIADKGWDKRSAGRPTNEEREREQNIQKRMDDEYNDDVERLSNVQH